MTSNLQEISSRLVPDLFEIMEGQNIPWKDINKGFNKIVEERRAKLQQSDKSHIQIHTNFFDVIIGVILGKSYHEGLLVYMNLVFRNLNKKPY